MGSGAGGRECAGMAGLEEDGGTGTGGRGSGGDEAVGGEAAGSAKTLTDGACGVGGSGCCCCASAEAAATAPG